MQCPSVPARKSASGKILPGVWNAIHEIACHKSCGASVELPAGAKFLPEQCGQQLTQNGSQPTSARR